MNLLQVLQTLSAKQPQGDNGKDTADAAETAAPAPPKPHADAQPRPNVMANVLERHEAISNRLRNKR